MTYLLCTYAINIYEVWTFLLMAIISNENGPCQVKVIKLTACHTKLLVLLKDTKYITK